MLWSLILRNIVSICNGYTNDICGYVTGKMANHFAMVWSLYLLYNFLEIKHYLHTPWGKTTLIITSKGNEQNNAHIDDIIDIYHYIN